MNLEKPWPISELSAVDERNPQALDLIVGVIYLTRYWMTATTRFGILGSYNDNDNPSKRWIHTYHLSNKFPWDIKPQKVWKYIFTWKDLTSTLGSGFKFMFFIKN